MRFSSAAKHSPTMSSRQNKHDRSLAFNCFSFICFASAACSQTQQEPNSEPNFATGAIPVEASSGRTATHHFCRLRVIEDGRVKVGALLQLHDSFDYSTQTCQEFSSWAAVQQTTAFTYMLKTYQDEFHIDVDSSVVQRHLQTAPLTTRLTSGLAFDACGSNQLAVELAQILAADSIVYRKVALTNMFHRVPPLDNECGVQNFTEALTRSPPLLAVIGPMSTSSTLATSPFLSNYQIPHISYWASSTLFDDVSDYPYLFRAVPSDKFQAEAIADLIEHFGWTFVSLIAAEDDAYSGQGFDLIVSEANRRQTFCLEISARFNKRPGFRDQLVSTVATLKQSSSRVVILYAPISAARVFLSMCQQINVDNKIFVGSHDWVNRLTFPENSIQVKAPILGLAPRAVASSSAQRLLQNLTQSLRDAEYIKAATTEDPWLRAYVEDQLQCTMGIMDSCRIKLMPSRTTQLRQCTDADIKRFLPRESMVIAESLILGMISTAAATVAAIRSHDLGNGTVPGGPVQLKILENLALPCKNYTSFCRVFDKLHHTTPTYYIQNVQLTANGFHDIVSIGHWKEGSRSKFEWYPDQVLDLKMFGNFTLDSTTPATSRSTLRGLPASNCSTTCYPGQHRVFNASLPMLCCWSCEVCAGTTFSNVTNADICTNCPLGFGSNGTSCSEFNPVEYGIKDPGFITVTCFAILGLILSVSTLLYFRLHPNAVLVKASDLTLSTLSMSAMIIGHCVALGITIPTSITSTYCTLSAVLPEPVKTIVVGSVLVKTKRFDSIFNSMTILSRNKTRRRLLGNPVQLAGVCMLTLINSVLSALYIVLQPPVAVKIPAVHQLTFHCSISHVWVSVLSAFNFLLLVTCIVLAFLTRKLPEEYNEAQLLYLASLTGFIVWLGLYPALVVTGPSLRPLIQAILLEGEMWAFWICLYAPRMIQMLRHERYRQRGQLKTFAADGHLSAARTLFSTSSADQPGCVVLSQQGEDLPPTK
ncbi:extracellular calcium-sensing receptor-like [Sycon ciliatum]|uniref:extracellular calcium-sensing receptor-like n=1 Tax=Sycon ciliatum TaxID=27933 RepID=UPI0031F6D4B7